jgi:hypothetical protein
MKRHRFNIIVFSLTILSTCACRTVQQPRVLRVVLNGNDHSTWKLAVNSVTRGQAVSSTSLTNQISQLHLHWGDVLLLAAAPSPGQRGVAETERWIFRVCQARRVAISLLDKYAGIDVFEVPAYHWTAPFENPFDSAAASFFREGRFLGSGTNGFANMLSQIERTHPKRIFILGSLYDMGRSFPPNSSPFEDERNRLDSVLRNSGTDLVLVEPLP